MSNDKANATYHPDAVPVSAKAASAATQRVARMGAPWRPSLPVAYALLLTFGWLGAHRWYQRKYLSGALYMVSFGGFGLGIIWDLCTLPHQIEFWESTPVTSPGQDQGGSGLFGGGSW